MRIIALFLALFCLAVQAVAAQPAAAQNGAAVEREAAISAAESTLAEIRVRIETGELDDVRAVEDRLRSEMRESRGRLRPLLRRLSEVEHALSQLGPAPAEDAAPESAPIAERRAALLQEISFLSGQRTRILANIDEAGNLLGALSAQRVTLLYNSLGERGHFIASPVLWSAAGGEAVALSGKVSRYFAAWSAARQSERAVVTSWLIITGVIAAAFFLLGPIRRWTGRTLPQRLEAGEPTPERRVVAAGARTLARLLPGVAGGFLVIEAARGIGLLGVDGLAAARALWFALIAYLLVDGFTRGLFSSDSPEWRVASIDQAKGRRVSAILLAIVGLFGLKLFAVAVIQTAQVGPALVDLIEALSAVAVGTLVFLLCRRQLWAVEPQPKEPADNAGETVESEEGASSGAMAMRWVLLRRFGRLVGLLIVVAAIAGFEEFADFAASRFYFLALMLIAAWFMRASLKELLFWGDERLHARFDDGEERQDREMMRFWIGGAVNLLLLLFIIPPVLALIGVGWASVRDIIWRAFLGFQVGGVTISLADILVAIGVFFAVLTGTRMLQGALQRGPFAHSRLDPGVQNSLSTLFGYIGLIVAAMAAVAALGFNLASLAIIAGALSVGIGFGLQSIVNNFLSGVILLFERPIKVGDWIVTSSGEGTVKKISVRSTEIETFDRASIIVPNSELISQSVTNWTHKNKLGRIIVPVGVSYNSDPEQVREILMQCAREHPLALRFPEPTVSWQGFGDSSLDFDVRMFVRDISTVLVAKTTLRFAIFKAFKEAGVEIPFPQRDLHIRTAPGAEPSRKEEKPAETTAPDVEPDAPDAETSAASDSSADAGEK